MPVIPSGKVLVSGANGFIAAWVVRLLLEAGFSVRGTVRSEAKCAHLRKEFASYGDRLELVIVPDITKEGAFDEAVKGVDAIEHTASPFHLNAVAEPDEFIVPAIQGTVGILESARKHGTSVKRIVITGSCAAVLQIEPEPKTFSELNWNEQAPKAVELGHDKSTLTIYRASKTLAERAAWEFFNEHKGEVGWDLVVINPPYVFGPTIHDTPTPDALNTSAREFYTKLTEPSSPATLRVGSCWVDVRDVGDAHVLALLKASAGGERIIVSAGPYVWQHWLDAAPDSPKFQKGVPGSSKGIVYPLQYDASKSVRVLGMTYRTMQETTRDTVADWEARGWQ